MCHKLQRMIIISEKIFFIFVEGIRDQLQLSREASRMYTMVAVAAPNTVQTQQIATIYDIALYSNETNNNPDFRFQMCSRCELTHTHTFSQPND